MTFKVAILQARSENANISKNVDIIHHAMKKASINNADILLLPECFITGYDLPMTYEKSISDDNEVIQNICALAKEYHMGVVLTSFTKGERKPQNTAFVISKQGNILMKYSKVHTCDFADEKEVEEGKEFTVCNFDGVKIGIMICYDREYPESARILMMKGAEIILVPNDCGSMKPRLQALSTRAYENMVGIAMANPNGVNAGCSCAYSPICWDENGECVDNTILVADDCSEGIFYAEFDMDKIREAIKEYFSKKKKKWYNYIKTLDREITNYFSGMGKNMLIQFIEYTLAFFIIGHPNYLILGILAAITNIIPYFGGFIVNVLALIIASVISTKLTVLTLIICLVCPQLDSYVIGPRVFGKSNNLHPLVNIFAVFAGGALFGFWGIIVSLPVAITIITTYKYFRHDINNKIDSIKEKI